MEKNILEIVKNKKRKTRYKQTLLQVSNMSELLLMLHGGSMS